MSKVRHARSEGLIQPALELGEHDRAGNCRPPARFCQQFVDDRDDPRVCPAAGRQGAQLALVGQAVVPVGPPQPLKVAVGCLPAGVPELGELGELGGVGTRRTLGSPRGGPPRETTEPGSTPVPG